MKLNLIQNRKLLKINRIALFLNNIKERSLLAANKYIASKQQQLTLTPAHHVAYYAV